MIRSNYTVLPFYEKLEHQDFRRNYSFGQKCPLIVAPDYFIPFQIILPTGISGNATFRLYRDDDTLVGTVSLSGVTYTSHDGYRVLKCIPNSAITWGAKGVFYLTATFGSTVLYSELFTFYSILKGMIIVAWSNEEDIIFEGGRVVASDFMNIMYICSELGKPEYPFTEEGEERDGLFYPEKQISEKTYKFTFKAPEYVLDAMRLARLSDYIEIYVENDTQGVLADSFLISPEWTEQGNIASVTAEFQTGTVIKKLGKGYLI